MRMGSFVSADSEAARSRASRLRTTQTTAVAMDIDGWSQRTVAQDWKYRDGPTCVIGHERIFP